MAKSRIPVVLLTLSILSVAGIATRESYRGVAYNDGVGVQTVGFGSTTHSDGRPVKAGDTLSPPRAVLRLAQSIDATQRTLQSCLPDVALTQYEWDAYVSLAYNIGGGAFCRSTLAKKLRASPPDYAGACQQILRWNSAGGQVLTGLTRRRLAEYQQCTQGATP